MVCHSMQAQQQPTRAKAALPKGWLCGPQSSTCGPIHHFPGCQTQQYPPCPPQSCAREKTQRLGLAPGKLGMGTGSSYTRFNGTVVSRDMRPLAHPQGTEHVQG